MTRFYRRAITCLLSLSLAACGGGGSVPSAVQPAPQPQATQNAAKSANVQFTIVIPTPAPATAKRPAYVSASTKSATISVGTTSTTVNCTSTCSATIAAPVGSDTFTAKLYDAVNGGGNLLSTGTLTQTIVAGQANNVNVTFNGVVASLAVAVAVVTPGTAGSAVVTVNALDSDGNVIIGPGSYINSSGSSVTISLSNSDTSGNSTLSQTSITQPTSVALNYTASFDTLPTISASASGFTTANATVAFPPPTITSVSFAGGLSGSGVSETLTGTNFVAGGTTVSAGSNVAVSGTNVTGPGTLTATFSLSGPAGLQNLTVATTAGTSAAWNFAIGAGTGFVLSINAFTDANAGNPAGTGIGTQFGGKLDLRGAILKIESLGALNSVIDFPGCTPSAPCTINLNGPLPPMNVSMIINAGAYGSVIISGQNLSRAFWAKSGTFTLADLEVENVLAQGGAGGGPNTGGGGGAGLGAGLFVDAATVSLVNDAFNNASVVGGVGGSNSAIGPNGGGGGGLSGNGGSDTSGGGGGGGGGILSAGGDSSASGGGSGGVGFSGSGGGSGGAINGTGTGGTGGNGAYGSGGGGGGWGGGIVSAVASGGTGGLGAGGGGAGNGGTAAANGGTGGFGSGGGGGGARLGSTGASGGPGGGGGGSSSATGGAGGKLSASLAGGSGGSGTTGTSLGSGGGGAAAGPAIFVYTGSVTTLNSFANSCTATGGLGGTGVSPGTAGDADATPVFNYGGTVNGVSVTAGNGGPVSGALPAGTP